ncbi:MAG: hypothetical protein CVT88_10690 [Candidatus Altiarchaeales archaeon HGW-Altiarchaeales-1]|nr:MAG: hypothetical protein CVT88_10690 [Candidatus Altiarchaeales archaeon HGW-Altiarchaeales-1]PKP57697.1 MAG: hypothetical protein CVT89_04075 [Candidatus Altiarchaeales archaeon HGW-Altiarchaeales-2]
MFKFNSSNDCFVIKTASGIPISTLIPIIPFLFEISQIQSIFHPKISGKIILSIENEDLL